MALLVRKYGGTSVGDLERIAIVADKIIEARRLGHQIVVVVSAMAGETDRLAQLAHKISRTPDPRELDVLLSTGEQCSVALLCLALLERGCPARSYTGGQVRIRTDGAYNKACILGIETSKIKADLSTGKVVVVAGFQGVDELGNITTLGRGGSDTTAVALAAVLKADECQVYTDVDGVYTADPRVVAEAKRLDKMSVAQVLELAGSGMKAMQNRAVELTGQYGVPVRVLSTFKEGPGTLITQEEENLEHSMVSCVTFNREEAKLMIHGVPDGAITSILGPVSQANIEIDMIVQTQNSDEKTMDVAFTVHRRDYARTCSLLENVKFKSLRGDNRVSKLTLVGMGMRSYASITAKIVEILGSHGINIQLISTSETKISVIIEEKFLELGIRVLHDAFHLGIKSEENLSAHGVL